MAPRPIKPRHLRVTRTRYGVPHDVAACSTMLFSRMVDRPDLVTCQRCKETNVYAELTS